MGGFSLNLGDILCIVAAIAGSLHIIFVEKVAKNDNVDSTLFTVFLLAFISLWGAIIGFFIGDLNYTAATPEHLGVIFSLEPASGCILSVLLLKETMSWTACPGSKALAAQECTLCKKCARLSGHPCVHPDKMRYALESLGMLAVKMVKDCFGFDILWSDGTSIPEYYLLVGGILEK